MGAAQALVALWEAVVENLGNRSAVNVLASGSTARGVEQKTNVQGRHVSSSHSGSEV